MNKETEAGTLTFMDELVYSNLAMLIGTTDPAEDDTMVKVPITLHIPENIFHLLTRICASIAKKGSTENVFDVYLSSVLVSALVHNSVNWSQSKEGKEALEKMLKLIKEEDDQEGGG